MIAVGIDVSKSKSTVAILNGDGSIRAKPFDVHHVADELQALVDYIKRTSEPPTILMEPTSHYHLPLLKAFTEADLPVCLINPYQMKKYGDTELRKAKTDKRDSLRIAQYALEKSYSLVPYAPSDQKYDDLRFLSRQYSQRISTLTVAKVQLLCLLDETMPGITSILPLKSRDPDNCVLLRFIKRFKSFDVIRKMGKTRFLDSYQVLVKKTKDRFAGAKGLAIYELVLNSVTTRGENPLSAMAQDQCVDLVSTSIFKCGSLQRPYRSIKCFALWPVWATDWGRSSSVRLVTFAVFAVVKLLMLTPVTMPRRISPDNSRAGIVTSPNVATRPSEKLVLRLCRLSNCQNLRTILFTFFCSKRNRKGNPTT